jgi:hypothetical protein
MVIYVDGGTGYGGAPDKIVWTHTGISVIRLVLGSDLVKARLDVEPSSGACIESVTVVTYSAGR